MSSSEPQNTLEALWQRANRLHAEGNWSQAVELYSQLLTIAPTFAPAYVQRGLIIHEMGNPEKAIHDFEHALQLDPRYGLAYYGRGWVKHTRGDYQGELQDAQRGLVLDPSNSGMYYRRIGAAQQGLKRYHDAITAYNQALSWNSEYDEGTLYNRGLCYLEMNEYALAMADFDRCIELDPDWAWAFAARGRVFLRMNNPERAIEDCTTAIHYQPDYVYSYLTRGLVYQEIGDVKRARADFEIVLQLSSSPHLRQLATQQLKQLPKRWWPFG